MRLLTAEGMRNIDDALIICTNRPRTVAEHLLVTVFLRTGEQVTGVVDVAKPIYGEAGGGRSSSLR